jgi:hypothetical protein
MRIGHPLLLAAERHSTHTMLGFFMAAGLLVVVGGVSAGNASLARGSEPLWDCGYRNVTVWLWPHGHKGFGTFSDNDRPWAYVMKGTRTKPSFTDRLAEAGAGPIGGASYGALCAPKGSLGSLTSTVNATASKPSRIRCSFPSNPLLHVQVLANGNRRLRVVLSPSQLVVIADVRTKGSTISYSTKYCTRTAAQ